MWFKVRSVAREMAPPAIQHQKCQFSRAHPPAFQKVRSFLKIIGPELQEFGCERSYCPVNSPSIVQDLIRFSAMGS